MHVTSDQLVWNAFIEVLIDIRAHLRCVIADEFDLRNWRRVPRSGAAEVLAILGSWRCDQYMRQVTEEVPDGE